MNPADRAFEDISVGERASFERGISDADVAAFARLTGDTNPLHTDAAYAAMTQFGKPIAHGMLLGSLFSTLVGMHLPGKRCLYLSQSLTFKKPVYAGDTLAISGTVTHKTEALRLLELSVEITRGSEVVVDGIARVQVLP